MKPALWLLLLVGGACSRPQPPATSDQYLQRYQRALRGLRTVSYQVQRIDTFTRQDVWNHTGAGLLQRQPAHAILGASFLVSQHDNAHAYYYDGRQGVEVDEQARTYVVTDAPFEPYILGSPGGQMLVEELLGVDSTYQRVSYQASPAGPALTFHYPDPPRGNERNRTITLVLDPATSLPRQVRTVVDKAGSRWSTHERLRQVRVNDPADAARLTPPAFLSTHTRVAPPVLLAPPSQVGQPAPGFELPSLTQTPVSLSQYRGRVVLLDFWTTWCSPCIGAMPELQQLQAQYLAQGLVVLGVLLDHDGEVAKPQGILERQGARYTNVLGTEAVRTAYNVSSYPRYVLVDKTGTIIYEGGGNSQDLLAVIQVALAAKTP